MKKHCIDGIGSGRVWTIAFGSRALFIATLFLSGGCSSLSPVKSTSISVPVAAEVAPYAMMASNAMHKADRVHFDLSTLGWKQVDLSLIETNNPAYSNWFTGLAFDIWVHEKSGIVVIAFRGTDSKWDYPVANLALPLSIPYKSAKKKVSSFIESNRIDHNKVVVVGHSLGGGIAASVSASPRVNPGPSGYPAYLFNSSPRIFDGLGDIHLEARRVLIYQEGEVLNIPRSFWTKFWDVVGEAYHIDRNNSGFNTHRSDILTCKLLERGAPGHPSVESAWSAMKEQCNNPP